MKFSDDRERSYLQRKMFYSELLNEKIVINYKKFPSISKFDEFGKLNLTKITRYRKTFDELKEDLLLLGILNHNAEHIKDSLMMGVNSQLSGEVYKDKNDFRNTIFSYSAAVEEMSNILLQTFGNNESYLEMTLGHKLTEIRNLAQVNPNYFIDLEVLEDLTKLIKSVRNDIIHPNPKRKSDSEVLEAQSNISHQIAVAFIRFAANAINSFKDNEGNLLNISEIEVVNKEVEYFFGFDGDNTGDFLDDSFKVNDEQILVDKSNIIKKAISKIKSEIKKNTGNNKSILFAEGDNVLFKMKYDHHISLKIQNIYQNETGMSSSIGFGESLQESAIALKLSKANGGNTIMGIKKEKAS
ncbi:MAG: mCpol domain-containing protein [Bacteroidota bacterium]